MKNNLMVRKNINVDKANNIPIATFKQEDDVVLKLALFSNSIALDCTGQTLKLGATRRDGTLIELTTGYTINKNEIDIVLTNNIIAVPGIVECDLEVKDASGKLTTASFFITSNKKVLGDNNIAGTNEVEALQKVNQWLEESKETLKYVNDNMTEIDGVKLLKGDKGDVGAQGPSGPQGPQGVQGPKGEAGLGATQLEATKQDKVDKTLVTNAKSIPGAINELSSSLDNIANKGTTVEVLERVTKEEIERQVADGTLANMTIANNSITLEKTAFYKIEKTPDTVIENSRQRFDVSIVEYDKYIKPDGTIGDATGNASASKFMDVKANLPYMTNASWDSAWYDENKKLIKIFRGDWVVHISPANAKYCRIAMQKGTENKIMFVQTDKNIDLTYQPFVPDTIIQGIEKVVYSHDGLKQCMLDEVKLMGDKRYSLKGDGGNGEGGETIKPINPLKGKKVLFMGDSITNQNPGWKTPFLIETEAILEHSSAKDGATWCVSEGNTNNLVNQVDTLPANLNPDIIIMFASTNDYWLHHLIEDIEKSFTNNNVKIPLNNVDKSKPAGSVRYCVETLHSKYQNSQLFLLTPLQANDEANGGLRNYAHQKHKSNLIQEIGNRLSIPIVNAFGESGIYSLYENNNANGKYLADGLHLNATGGAKVGKYIANKVQELYIKEKNNVSTNYMIDDDGNHLIWN